MFSDRLRFELEAKDEGLKSGFEAAQQAADGLDQTILRLQGTTINYNSATGLFNDAQGKAVNSHKALNSIGIKTTAQLTREIAVLDRLAKQYGKNSIEAQQLIARKQQLQQSFSAVNRSAGSSSQIFFQAGQAISDFSVAGIRGAANNLEFLALQLGVAGPVMIGLSLATAAFFAFGDDITKAFQPIKEGAKEVASSLSEILQISEAGSESPTVILFRDQIPAALEESRLKVEELQKAAFDARPVLEKLSLGAIGLLTETAIRNPFRDVSSLEEELAGAQGAFDDLEKRSDKLQADQKAAAASLANSVVAQNAAAAELIRNGIERLGLEEQLADTTNKRLLELAREGELEEFIAELQEEKKRSSEKNLSDLEKAIKLNGELSGLLTRINSGEEDKRLAIERQNRALQEQVKIAQTLRELQQRGVSTTPTPLSGLGLDGSNQSLDDLLEAISKRNRAGRRNALKPRGLSAAEERLLGEEDVQVNALNDIASGADRMAEAFERAQLSAEFFYTRTREGQLSLLDTISATTGGISEIYKAAYEASDEESERFFGAYKAFAIAQATISTYVAANEALKAGPIIGPILAAATIAQGLANVIRIRSASPGGGGSGGGSISGGGRGTVTSGTATRAIPITRDTSTFIPGSVAASNSLKLQIVESETVTPSGDVVRRIRLAQASEVRAGRSGSLEVAQ